MAQWVKQGGLTCEQCEENGLLEQGVVSCEDCKKPRISETNYIVTTLYSFNPVRPIPMTDGLVLLDLSALQFIMDVYDIPHKERKSLLERISVYHNVLYSKKSIKKDTDGEAVEGKEE